MRNTKGARAEAASHAAAGPRLLRTRRTSKEPPEPPRRPEKRFGLRLRGD